MHFEIKPLTAKEIEGTVRMWRRSRDEVQPEIEARMGYSAADDFGFFTGVLMRNCAIWLALHESQPIGMLAMSGNMIEQLYVDPKCQGHGIGSALIERAKHDSPDGLELKTHLSNIRARRFYENHAFSATAFGVSPAPESEKDVTYVWSAI